MKQASFLFSLLSLACLPGCDFGISYFAPAATTNGNQSVSVVTAVAEAKALDVPGTSVFDASSIDQIQAASVDQSNSNFILNNEGFVVLNTTPSSGLATEFIIQTPTAKTYLRISLQVTDQSASVPTVWGRNQNSNVLLTGSSGVASPSPQSASVSAIAFKEIAASRSHVCGLSVDGTAYCWGEGDYGRLGTNAQVDTATPLAVQTSMKFRSISVAGANWGGDRAHTCALSLLGKAYCWGRNLHGQLGNGTTVDSLVPVAVSSPLVFKSLALAASSSCGITATHEVYCWGANDHGQLGQGTTTSSLTPVHVAGNYSSLATGMDGFCAIQSASSFLTCWGVSDRGSTTYIQDFQSSTVDDMMTPLLSPTTFDSARTYSSLSGGASSFCALSSLGEAYCWGHEMYGRLGLSSKEFYAVYYTPRKIAGTYKFKSISCGQSHTIAIDENDELYGWGKNENGELGVGFVTTGSSPLPAEGPYGIYSAFKLDSTDKFSSLSVSDDFALALRK